MAEQGEDDALQAKEERERHDERRQSQPGDQQAFDRADDHAAGHASQHREAPGHVVRRCGELGGHDRADTHVEAGRQVDLAKQQNEDLGHAEDDEIAALVDQVDQVAGGEELAVLALEDDDQRDQADDDRQDAAVTRADLLPLRRNVFAERVGDQLVAPQQYGVGRGRHRVRQLDGAVDGGTVLGGRHRAQSFPAAEAADPDSPPVVMSSTARWVSSSEIG